MKAKLLIFTRFSNYASSTAMQGRRRRRLQRRRQSIGEKKLQTEKFVKLSSIYTQVSMLVIPTRFILLTFTRMCFANFKAKAKVD
jgi:hypothetical protein